MGPADLGTEALPLPSLRLLVSPLQLSVAVMWRALRRLEVEHYWAVAQFVGLLLEMVPELLTDPHWTPLGSGLRAKYILELCRADQPVDPEQIRALLDTVARPLPPRARQEQVEEQEEEPVEEQEENQEQVEVNFVELVHTMLKDPEVKQHFFTEVFPVVYGPDYDQDLLTLFEELLYRLAQLLPVPDLGQTVSWLGSSSSLLDDCSVSSTHLRGLLHHHRQLGHLEEHVPPSSMGNCILSSLASPPPARPPNQSASPQRLGDHALLSPFADGVAEVVTVTDYAEVELGTTGHQPEEAGECMEEVVMETEVVMEKETEEEGPTEVDPAFPDEVKQEQGAEAASPARPHVCPDCQKRFRFASSLTAHRVVHTRERPHRCSACGRCFSFRQSLDRHRHTHETATPRNEQQTDAPQSEPERDTPGTATPRSEHQTPTTRTSTPRTATPQSDQPTTTLQTATPRSGQQTTTHQMAPSSGGGGRDEDSLCDRKPSCEPATADPESAGVEPHPPRVKQEAGVDRGDAAGERVESGAGLVGGLAPALVEQVVSLVAVRTSGRKRRPTMKVQVINLQKRLGKGGATVGVEPKRRKPGGATAPFNSSEHSYGSAEVLPGSAAAEDGAEGGSSQVLGGSAADLLLQAPPPPPPPGAGCQDNADDTPAADLRDGRFGCPDCAKSFRFRSLLASHRRVHTGEQPFLCPACGRRFSFKQSLERHRRTHAAGPPPSPAERQEPGGANPDPGGGAFLCSRCGRAFSAKSALLRHARTHGEETPMGASGVAPSPGGEQQQEEALHTCDCGKSFPYRAALTAHQRVHREERPHACAHCPKRFLYRGGLTSHAKTHCEDKPFACSFCGKSFKRERNMKKHERCHTRDGVFRCSQCDKSFVYKATLTRHELTHSGERPFLCCDCGKGFYSHAELLKHERFHTGHKPFQCPFCGKRFTQSCYLTIHVRYHTGARPYACPDCDKSFMSANRLKRHQRTHTGEKPYLCPECGRGFRQSYHLKVHLRTHAYA